MPQMAKTTYVRLRCDPLEQERWYERAKNAGLDFSSFIRTFLEPNEPLPARRRPQAPVTTRSLCERCQRIGVPSCSACRHVFFGEPQ